MHTKHNPAGFGCAILFEDHAIANEPGDFTTVTGDIDNGGFVGIEDLDAVLGNWNAGTTATYTDTVPEPGAAAIPAVGASAMLRRR